MQHDGKAGDSDSAEEGNGGGAGKTAVQPDVNANTLTPVTSRYVNVLQLRHQGVATAACSTAVQANTKKGQLTQLRSLAFSAVMDPFTNLSRFGLKDYMRL